MNKDFIKKNLTLIIACTVDTKSIIHSKRNNIDDRLNDLNKSLPIWLSKEYFKNIIIVENSNCKPKFFSKIIENSSNSVNIDFIQYDGQDFDRNLGKGYGWAEEVKQAIRSKKFGINSDYFCLVPGRYQIPNFDKILFKANKNLICNINLNLSFAFSPITIFPRNFIENYWLPECKNINDSLGLSMEHCQAKALLRAIADGYDWELPYEGPILNTISAISNTNYNKGFIFSIILKYYSYLKKFVFEFKR
tara:strand:- start:2508 stop:3254 length:747 start_codon:yes stop_codon:yes gene_type:complete